MILHLVSGLLTAASATSFYIRPFSEFTQTAPNIVRGIVHDIHAENGITADGGKTIYTYATVDVRETLKGKISAPAIRVRKVGGTKDGVTLDVPSSPEFSENEDTVLFLSDAREDQSYEVTGLELGKFGTREENGEVYLEGGILGYAESDAPHSAPSPAKDLSENRRPWTLSQLRELVKSQNAGTETAQSSQSPAHLVASESQEVPAPETKGVIRNPHEPVSNSNPAEPSGKPLWRYAIVGILAVGIFLFFKRRG